MCWGVRLLQQKELALKEVLLACERLFCLLQVRWYLYRCCITRCEDAALPSQGERLFIELMTSDRKLKASKEGLE